MEGGAARRFVFGAGGEAAATAQQQGGAPAMGGKRNSATLEPSDEPVSMTRSLSESRLRLMELAASGPAPAPSGVPASAGSAGRKGSSEEPKSGRALAGSRRSGSEPAGAEPDSKGSAHRSLAKETSSRGSAGGLLDMFRPGKSLGAGPEGGEVKLEIGAGPAGAASSKVNADQRSVGSGSSAESEESSSWADEERNPIRAFIYNNRMLFTLFFIGLLLIAAGCALWALQEPKFTMTYNSRLLWIIGLWFTMPLLGYAFMQSIMSLLELALRHEQNRERKFRITEALYYLGGAETSLAWMFAFLFDVLVVVGFNIEQSLSADANLGPVWDTFYYVWPRVWGIVALLFAARATATILRMYLAQDFGTRSYQARVSESLENEKVITALGGLPGNPMFGPLYEQRFLFAGAGEGDSGAGGGDPELWQRMMRYVNTHHVNGNVPDVGKHTSSRLATQGAKSNIAALARICSHRIFSKFYGIVETRRTMALAKRRLMLQEHMRRSIRRSYETLPEEGAVTVATPPAALPRSGSDGDLSKYKETPAEVAEKERVKRGKPPPQDQEPALQGAKGAFKLSLRSLRKSSLQELPRPGTDGNPGRGTNSLEAHLSPTTSSNFDPAWLSEHRRGGVTTGEGEARADPANATPAAPQRAGSPRMATQGDGSEGGGNEVLTALRHAAHQAASLLSPREAAGRAQAQPTPPSAEPPLRRSSISSEPAHVRLLAALHLDTPTRGSGDTPLASVSATRRPHDVGDLVEEYDEQNTIVSVSTETQSQLRRRITKEEMQEVLEQIASGLDFEDIWKSRLDPKGTGYLSSNRFNKIVDAMFKDRQQLSLTLQDSQVVIKSIDTMILSVLSVIIIMIAMAMFSTNTFSLLSSLAASLVAWSFIFGESVRTSFNNLIYIFSVHQMDVGDRVTIQGTRYEVVRIRLLYTDFIKDDGAFVRFPNVDLSKCNPILNHSTANNHGVSLQVFIPVQDLTSQLLRTVRESLEKYVKERVGLLADVSFTAREIVHPFETGMGATAGYTSYVRCRAWLQFAFTNRLPGQVFKEQSEFVAHLCDVLRRNGIVKPVVEATEVHELDTHSRTQGMLRTLAVPLLPVPDAAAPAAPP